MMSVILTHNRPIDHQLSERLSTPVRQDAKPLPRVAVKASAQESSVNGTGVNGPTFFEMLSAEPFLHVLSRLGVFCSF